MRGISSPVGESLMLLAVITASMVIVSALIYNISLMSSEIKSSGAKAAAYIATSITFIDAYVNSSNGCHYIFLKNTGTYSITNLGNSTLFLGNPTSIYLLNYGGYNTSVNPGQWSFVDIEKPNQIWEVSETLKIVACPPVALTPPYKIIVTLPTGNTFTWSYGG